MSDVIKPNTNSNVIYDVRPGNGGCKYLHYQHVSLAAGQTHDCFLDNQEMALLPLRGKGRFQAKGEQFDVSRDGVFSQVPHLLYVPPGIEVRVQAETDLEFTLGGAQAEGRYPMRFFSPDEMKMELRGGGAAYREIHHVLSHPMPAERLIIYEVYISGGSWSGWPPHCHDGSLGSPYLEESYLFYMEPSNGIAVQRNYRVNDDYDEAYTIHDGDFFVTPPGFHSTIAAPGYNLYFLNYLAGELYDDDRKTPPYSDPEFTWINKNWEANFGNLPIVRPTR